MASDQREREGKDEPLGEDGVHPLDGYDKIKDKALCIFSEYFLKV